MSPSPRINAWPPSPFVLTGAFTPANSGRLMTLFSITLATMLPPAGLERITAFALFRTAASFATVEMSGWGFPAGTASPISDRPSGMKLPGFTPPSSDSVLMSSKGSVMTSPGGVTVWMSLTIFPIPLVTIVTFTPVSLVYAAARSLIPALTMTPGAITRISAGGFTWALAGMVSARQTAARTDRTVARMVHPFRLLAMAKLGGDYTHAASGPLLALA